MIFDEKLNGHAVGIIMKELVRRALGVIQAERISFESHAKQGYHDLEGEMNDVLTSADLKAQDIYVRSLRECFPSFGIISEEGVSEPGDTYFTIDPVDGTRAFVRGQSHGIGTMIALIHKGECVAAYIGDVNTGEIFGFRPGSSGCHRITNFEAARKLQTKMTSADPLQGYVLLRDPLESHYSPATGKLVRQFKNYLVDGGSIGIWLARLWKREVTAAVIPEGTETPWDQSPIVGISQKLGYLFLSPDPETGQWTDARIKLSRENQQRGTDLLVIHRDDCSRLSSEWSDEMVEFLKKLDQEKPEATFNNADDLMAYLNDAKDTP
jgi:fructose-1,6-bisphosphatase/inositol monophosphatase family enzyme